MRVFLLLSALVWQFNGFAQDTLLYKRYSFAHYTNQSFQSIAANSTLVNLPSDWDDTLSGNIALPLNFYYQNVRVDSIAIHTNGSLVLNNTPVSYFDEGQIFGVTMDYESKNRAKIYYGLSGQSPNRIFMVEYSNLGLLSDTMGNDSITFQIWLKEIDSSIEFHIGPHNIDNNRVAKNSQEFVLQNKYAPFLGIINNAGDSLQPDFDRVYFHHASHDNTSYKDAFIKMNKLIYDISATTYVNSSLKKIPPPGDVFVFKPNEYAIINVFARLTKAKVFPNPSTQGIFTFSDIKVPVSYAIYNSIGQKMSAGEAQENHIDIAFLPKGIYYVVLRNKVGSYYSKVEKL